MLNWFYSLGNPGKCLIKIDCESPMRLLGKQSSRDSAAHVSTLTILCINELLAHSGPAHHGAVLCVCPGHHKIHSIMKELLSH